MRNVSEWEVHRKRIIAGEVTVGRKWRCGAIQGRKKDKIGQDGQEGDGTASHANPLSTQL